MVLRYASFVGLLLLGLIFLTFIAFQNFNVFPFISIEPLKKFAAKFDPHHPPYNYEMLWSGDKEWPCKNGDDLALPHDVATVLRYRTIDEEYENQVMTIWLKLYKCHFNQFGGSQLLGETLEGSVSPFYVAYKKVLGRQEYYTTFHAFVWPDSHPFAEQDPTIKKLLFDICTLMKKKWDRESVPRDCLSEKYK